MTQQHERGKGKAKAAKRRRITRPRGMGSVFLRGRKWWIKYKTPAGTWCSETSDSGLKGAAEDLLKQRLREAADGRTPSRIMFEDAAAMLEAHYRANERRSTRDMLGRVKRLREAFGK